MEDGVAAGDERAAHGRQQREAQGAPDGERQAAHGHGGACLEVDPGGGAEIEGAPGADLEPELDWRC